MIFPAKIILVIQMFNPIRLMKYLLKRNNTQTYSEFVNSELDRRNKKLEKPEQDEDNFLTLVRDVTGLVNVLGGLFFYGMLLGISIVLLSIGIPLSTVCIMPLLFILLGIYLRRKYPPYKQ